MKWKKLGLIFNVQKNFDWMWSHAANPFALNLKGSLYRIYFSCRNRENKSHVGFVEVDLKSPKNILKISEKPVVSPGAAGEFDQDGISLGNIVSCNEKFYLYYTGWKLEKTVPWKNQIGLATSTDGVHFTKSKKNPVVPLDEIDPHSLSYPWVELRDEKWTMWYGSNLIWGKSASEMDHVIKLSKSADGLSWSKSGEHVLELKPGEIGLSRPCVLRENRISHLWYSIRKKNYQMGYAFSDKTVWKRDDKNVGIEVSKSGWDSESIEYPHVFHHEKDLYMLYCGNGHGKTGFGLAKCES